MPSEAAVRLAKILGGDRDLVFEFFLAFSRFEYALKATRYRNKKPGRAQIDWNEFARRNEGAFDRNDPEIKKAFEYLNTDPPKEQVVNEKGNLKWDDNSRIDNMGDLEWAIRLVKTTRNNLFHGGKFPYDPVRDKDLIGASMSLLEYFSNLDPNLRQEFEQMAPIREGVSAPY